MKILYVCHRFPFPPNRGGKIRPFYMIKHFSQKHEVVVVSLVRSTEEAKAGEGLKAFCSRWLMARITEPMAWGRMVLRLPTSVPSSMGYFYSPVLAHRIHDELETGKFDLVFVHCSSVAQYVEKFKGIPKILDFGDMDSQKWLAYAKVRWFPLNLGYWLEGVKMERAEIALAKQFDLCTCTTPGEVRTLDDFKTGTPSAWFPNGVNSEYFKPASEPYDPDLISFVGRMDYFPNSECIIDFCRSTLPLLKKKRPRIKLVIVGADPPKQVIDLARIEGVTVTGSVLDVRLFVQNSALSIAPLRIARGTQNKILESLSMGVPVVASPAAGGGIDAVSGEHFLTASTPEEYAEAILQLLSDPARRRRFAEAGRDRMLSNHSWEGSMKKLDGIIEECLARVKGAAAGKKEAVPAR